MLTSLPSLKDGYEPANRARPGSISRILNRSLQKYDTHLQRSPQAGVFYPHAIEYFRKNHPWFTFIGTLSFWQPLRDAELCYENHQTLPPNAVS